MNVLVYAGPEIVQPSLSHTLASLRHLLVPNYTVQPITLHALTTQPWQASCALLVLPRTRARFVSAATRPITDFVERGGGALLVLGTDAAATPRSHGGLGLGLGATGLTLGSAEEAGERPLKFYDRLSNCYITTEEEHRVGARAVALRSADGAEARGIYDTEAARFEGFSAVKDVSILARYATEGAAEGTIAGLVVGINQGRVAFWGPSVEYPLTEAPASAALSSLSLTAEEVSSSDQTRKTLLATTLSQLGLKVPQEKEHTQTIARPLPQFLTSAPDKPSITDTILDAIAAPQSGAQLTTFKDANDELHFHPLQESAALLATTRAAAQTASDPSTWQPKHIVLFYTALGAARRTEGLAAPSSADLAWGIGEALLYGEAITSTQTMLDKNPRLLAALPVPVLSLASHQLAGRGRGSNTWLSPAGCLQFSLALRVALDRFPAGRLVFVQYLFSLAVVEACRAEAVLGADVGAKVRIKWPNDLYAATGPGKTICGRSGVCLLIRAFRGVKWILSSLAPAARAKLSMERTAAAIMAKFEQMWGVFVQGNGSFAPFIDLYLERWLHSDQPVTLTTTTPHTRVRIAGITLDYGLLRTVPERSGISSILPTTMIISICSLTGIVSILWRI
ncbi:biotin-ligase [Pholiota molesta]|nr:biotin-ligase [Pholiota molesta]